jgi:hypothetical protein
VTDLDADLADEFLTTVYGDGEGFAALGFKSNGKVQGKFYRWPRDADSLLAEVERRGPEGDVFWSPLLRTTTQRAKGNAAARSWVWVDLDGPTTDPHLLQQLAPILVRSGRPGHLHAYVRLTESLENERWHCLIRLLRDRLGGDRSKTADNDFLRLPGTINFKPELDRPTATLVRQKWTEWEPEALEDLLASAARPTRDRTDERVSGAHGRNQTRIPTSVRRALREWRDVQAGERSEAFYAIVRECRKRRLSVDRAAELLEGHPAAERYERQGRLLQQVETIWDKTEAEESPTTPAEGRRLQVVRASEVRPKRQKWLVPNRIPLGALTLMGGREGSGKSSICVDYAARVTRGELDGELRGQPRGVIYFATEDDRSTVLVPRLTVARADLSRVIFLEPEEPDGDLLTLPSDNDELDELIGEYDVSLVVLDPILSVLERSVNDTNPRELRRELEPINQMAARRDCSFLGIAHFNKRESSDIGVLMSGLLVWSQVARATIGVVHDPDDEDPDSFIMSNGKNNSASRATASLRGRLVPTPLHTDDGPTTVPRVEWLGESELSVSDVMSPERPKKDVERWLLDLLTEHGPMSRPEILEMAESTTTFSRTSIDRAKKNLGIESTKTYQGPARWSLPSSSRERAARTHDDTEKIENIDNVEDVGRSSSSSSTSSTFSTSSTLSGVARARAREWVCPDCGGAIRVKLRNERVWMVPNHAEDCAVVTGKGGSPRRE